jgi:hypothetical protein
MKSGSMVNVLSIIVFFTLSTSNAWAQLSSDDSVFFKKATDNTKAIYFESLGDQSGLLNGSQYAGYPFGFKDGGHPFFYTNVFLKGTIEYDRVLYPEAFLQYDEVMDVIIFQDATHRIQLIGERILRFSLLNNNFIRIVKDSGKRALVSTGFYHLLYEGNICLLKKEVKSIREVLISNTEGIYRYIDVKKYYYIKKNNEYYPVKRKKTLLELYKDRKKEMQQYIKRNKLNYKRDPDNFLIKATAYYDQLTK